MNRKIKFYRPVDVGGTFFCKGEHDVDETILQHWLIKGMIKDGNAVVIEVVEEVAVVDSNVTSPAQVQDTNIVGEPQPDGNVTPTTGEEVPADGGENKPKEVTPGQASIVVLEALDTVNKLRAFAKEKGIKIPGSITKEEDIREYLEKALPAEVQ